jgi:hypothetical protein
VLDFFELKVDGCDHFKWKEVLRLPRWEIYATPESQNILNNIIRTTQKMDLIRKFFGAPITVTSFYRPNDYNKLIGGATLSAHRLGLACDFIVKGVSSKEARLALFPRLMDLNIRMEKLETAHVHIDLQCEPTLSNERRFFLP